MSTGAPTSVDANAGATGCPACREPVFEDERFCEACGTRVGADPDVGDDVGPAGAPEPTQRITTDLGVVAAVSDRGWRRHRNEDAAAVAAFGDRAAVVVCDGVASTANPDAAAQGATTAAIGVLETALASKEPLTPSVLGHVFSEAFGAAQRAVVAVPDDEPDGNDLSPSTTMVASVAMPGHVVVANVGDCRAYWLGVSAADHRTLTVDDSRAQEMIDAGVAAEEAYVDPEAHTITRWLGADAESVEPAVTLFDVAAPGLLIVCSDGLWNYFERPAQLAEIVAQAAHATPLEIAGALVDAALEAGGHDNITVAAVRVGPVGSTAASKTSTTSIEE